MATARKTPSDATASTGPTASPFGAMPSFEELGRLLQTFSVPGIDMKAVLESQRKDLEALAEANRQAYEGMQALARRRSEMLTEAFERWQSMLAGSGADADSSPAELVQQGLQQAMEDFRELAQIEAESRGRAWKTLQDRMQQNLADMQKRLTPKP